LNATLSADATAPRRVYVIRHGVCDPADKLLGQFDAPLSAAGERQAGDLARRLEGQGIERILSSSLQRAVRTAELMGKHLGVETATDARLNEISYGIWDGLRWAEIERIDPETARRKLEDWWGVTPLGGESLDVFYGRVERGWLSLADHPAKVTAVVAHRAVNAVLLALACREVQAADAPGEPRWKGISTFEQEHCGFEVVAAPVRFDWRPRSPVKSAE
jgi:2,3-bisphosphoglycerate-dependent phosphoglycerate mutase